MLCVCFQTANAEFCALNIGHDACENCFDTVWDRCELLIDCYNNGGLIVM